jgi:hypothetical protein
MNVFIWLPAMLALGLLTFAAMFACIAGCDNV